MLRPHECVPPEFIFPYFLSVSFFLLEFLFQTGLSAHVRGRGATEHQNCGMWLEQRRENDDAPFESMATAWGMHSR